MAGQMRAACRFLAAIETSCDETSFSVLEFSTDTKSIWANPNENDPATPSDSQPLDVPCQIRVLSHLVHAQTELHSPFGGVVPEVAARDHLAKLPQLSAMGLAHAGIRAADLGAIAVTAGPGLIGAVMVGYLFAQGLAEAAEVPLIAVNHVDAHLAPATLLTSFNPATDCGKWLPIRDPLFPRISLTVSGGHCIISLWRSPSEQQILGTTLDDACGEAFDKVAKLLGLGYPGGPALESRAAQGNQKRFPFALPLAVGQARLRADSHSPFCFSFSGLKTAALRIVQGLEKTAPTISEQDINDVAAGFQDRALEHLCDRLQRALAWCEDPAQGVPIKELVVAGGVAANRVFRERLGSLVKVPVYFAPPALCGDNATMIGLQALLGGEDGRLIQPFSRYFSSAQLPDVFGVKQPNG
jgi:N6-L-threonylcarbamoyladenine synthase